MRKKISVDGKIGIGFFLFSLLAYFVIIPSQVRVVSYGSVGFAANVFPNFSAFSIALTSLALFFSNYFMGLQTSLEKVEARAVLIMMFLVGYLLLIILFGYYIALFVFLLALMRFLNREKFPFFKISNDNYWF